MEILKTISTNLACLPKTQQKVAKYILKNWDKVTYESTIQIANHLGLSQSTVIRTAVSLGYEGFPELQKALREFVQYRVSTVNRLDRAALITDGQNTRDLINFVFKQNQDNLRRALQQLNPDEIDAAVNLINRAGRIFVVGLRSSAAIADYLGVSLNMVYSNVTVLTSDFTLFEKMNTLTADDVVIIASFQRYTRMAVDAAGMAQKKGCAVISITDSMASPLIELSNIQFIVPGDSMHFNISFVSALSVVDVLLTALARKSGKIIGALEELEEVLHQLKIFWR